MATAGQMTTTTTNHITPGCIVLVQKGSFTKHCKVIPARPQAFGGKRDGFKVSFDGAIGELYGSTFKLLKSADRKGVNMLQKITFEEHTNRTRNSGYSNSESGQDNRDLTDDGTSQKLSKEEIQELKHSGATGKELIDVITANSSTFSSKTRYSQEKYVNKKGKKYDELVTLHKPTIDLIADMLFTMSPHKISFLRGDTLFQLLLHSNLCPGGRAAVFDSGTLNLVTAGIMHRLGVNGRLVNVFSGRKPFPMPLWSAVDMMDWSSEELAPLSHININRIHHARLPGRPDGTDMPPLVIETEKVNSLNGDAVPVEEGLKEEKLCSLNPNKRKKFVRNIYEDEMVSKAVLEAGVFSVVVACKQHPLQPTMALYPYLLPGCPFAIFSQYKEPLLELYMELKCNGGSNLHLSETWMREYQVKPDRTHPMVNMSGSGGYLLVGTKIHTH